MKSKSKASSKEVNHRKHSTYMSILARGMLEIGIYMCVCGGGGWKYGSLTKVERWMIINLIIWANPG